MGIIELVYFLHVPVNYQENSCDDELLLKE